MTRTRLRLTVWLIGAVAALVGLVFWWVSYYSRKEGTADTIPSVPGLERTFEGWNSEGRVRYSCTKRYRYDEIHVAGRTDPLSVRKGPTAFSHWTVWEVSKELPASNVEEVIRELDPCALESWSVANWTAFGSDDKGMSVHSSYDPKSGRFWAVVYRSHGEPR